MLIPNAASVLVQRYASAAWRLRWPALGLAWVVCLAGWAGVYGIPNKFESSARLYVDSDAVLTPLLHGLTIDSSPSNQVEVLQRTLLSRPNMEKLIAKTDLDQQARTPRAREALIQQLAADIKVVPQTKNLFTITYRNPQPRLAYDVVRTIIALFMEGAVGNNRTEMDGAQRFLAQQLATYETQLRQAEQRRAAFQTRNLDLLPGADGKSNLDSARTAVAALQEQLQDASNRQSLLLEELAKTTPLLVTEQPGSPLARSEVVALAERELAELRLRDTERHPDVIAARNHLAALKAMAPPAAGPAPGSRSVSNPVFEQLKVRTIDAEATIASLTRRVADAIKERERLELMARREPEAQAEFVNIDRDYNVLRHNYDELLARRESMRIARAASTDSDKVKLDIVDPPTVSAAPVSPNRPVLLVGVMGAGIAAAAGLVFILMQADRSFISVNDLRSFGLPVIGAISLALAPIRRRSVGGVIGFGAAVMLLLAVFSGLLLRPLVHG